MEQKINLHTHTYRCRHGEGNVSDYCREAVKNGLTVLGFSEHVAFADERLYETCTRMPYQDLPLYRADIAQAETEFPSLKILAGLELEYEPDCLQEIYPALIERLDLDYCIGGVHYVFDDPPDRKRIWLGRDMSLRNLKRFAESNIRFMETGLIVYLAHPDISFCGMNDWDENMKAACRDVIRASIDLHVPIELNANGLRKGPQARYPWVPLWEMAAEMGAECVVGADAHKPNHVWDHIPDLQDIAEKCGLQIVNEKIVQKILAPKK